MKFLTNFQLIGVLFFFTTINLALGAPFDTLDNYQPQTRSFDATGTAPIGGDAVNLLIRADHGSALYPLPLPPKAYSVNPKEPHPQAQRLPPVQRYRLATFQGVHPTRVTTKNSGGLLGSLKSKFFGKKS